MRFYNKDEGVIELKLPGKLRIYGNIMVRFLHSRSFALSPSELFRVTFNTAFISTENVLEVDRCSISPENCAKETDRYSDAFRCQLFFEDYCWRGTDDGPGCRSHRTPLNRLCSRCKSIMLDEVDKWYEATKTLDSTQQLTIEQAREIIPGQEESIEDARNLELKWPPYRYKIESEYFQRKPHELLNGSLKRAGAQNGLLEDLNEEFASADRLAEKDVPQPSSTMPPEQRDKNEVDVRSKSKSQFAEISKDSECSSFRRFAAHWQLSDKTPAFGPDEKKELKEQNNPQV